MSRILSPGADIDVSMCAMDEHLGDSQQPWTPPGAPLPTAPASSTAPSTAPATAPATDPFLGDVAPDLQGLQGLQGWSGLPGDLPPEDEWGHLPPSRPPLGDKARLIGLGMSAAALLVVVAAFLPWVRIDDVTLNGLGGGGQVRDGVVTLPLALPVAVLGMVRAFGQASVPAAITSTVIGFLVALLAAHDLGNLETVYRIAQGYLEVTTGVGLGLTLLGGLGMGALGMVGLVVRR
jgi:hypothetical protein